MRIKYLGLGLGLVLQAAALFALNDPPLTVRDVPPANEAYLSDTVLVKVFSIHGSAGGTLKIRLVNAISSDLLFDADGIESVELRSGLNSDYSGGSPVSNTSGRPIEGGAAYQLSFTHTGSASTTNYAIYYKISATAKYSITGGTDVFVNAKIDSLQEGDNEAVQISDSYVYSIKVKANGLVYKPSSLKTMLPSNSTGVPANITFAIMQFTLRAETSEVGIKSLSLGSAENFATSTENRDESVRRIILLADNGDGDYSGPDRETIVCDTGLLSYDKNGNTKEIVELPFGQTITLSAYSVSGGGVPNTQLSEKVFYVLYELGAGFPTGKTLTCRLIGGSGVLNNGNASSLRLGSAASTNISVVCRLADAWLISANALVHDPLSAVAGQRGIRMIDFSYLVPDTHQPIQNVVIEVANAGGTFQKLTDEGVNRVLLYKYPPVLSGQQTPSLVGVGDILDSKKVVFRSQTLEPGPNQYYVVYDIGVLAAKGMSAQAQVVGISVSTNSRNSNSSASFWSPAAPPGPAFINLYPNRALIGPIRVTDTSGGLNNIGNDITSIEPGQTFYVFVPIYNESESVDRPPAAGPAVQMEVVFHPSSNLNSTRPVFYAGSDFGSDSTERSDISSEFTWSNPLSFGNILPIYNEPTVATFTVTAQKLKTNGTVYVDAQVLYDISNEAGSYMQGSPDAPPAAYRAYYSPDKRFRSAAAGLGSGSIPAPSIPGYVTLQLNGSGSIVTASSWPEYILPGGISFTNSGIGEEGLTKVFINGDKIPPNSSLTISLNAELEAQLNYNFMIYQNGILLKRYEDWFLSETDATIYFPEKNFPETSAGTAGVIRIIPNNPDNPNDTIEETTLRYEILPVGQTMEIKEVLPYPTPYDPDTGPLYVGFENNSMDSGVMTVRIYDVTGREVYREEELKVLPGYNMYTWAGDFSSGGKVGRGVYVLRMTFKGSGKRHEVVTRFGVK
ncbi:hypothetical protein NO1_0109 [Candidatus Termititenax aidoneus]|uniref:FlgD Ig-like domain-containing protein n=1 Tax=Termititenax aidoneus TaxID=2218524 RepID=A0A388T7T0_TERA1|nr:hypothetical protein NO1_0109 [Candidatus Termititenax aidoneus]